MRFLLSLVVGIGVSAIGFYAAAAGPGASLSSALGFFFFAFFAIPIGGGLVYFVASAGDPESDESETPRARWNKTGTVMLGLFLGTLLGPFLASGS